jgi:hypothetical protein
LEATTDYADKTDRDKKQTMARRPDAPQAGCLCYKWSAHSGNAALEKHCPESVRSFVVLIKNEINNDEAKYEHADNDTGKTRESSSLLQGRAPKRRDSGLDCSKRNPGAAAEVSGVSGRLSDDGNRNQYFCRGGREPASVPRCRVR